MEKNNKNVSLVDLGKLFFAFCVLGIHTHAFPGNEIIHYYIFAFAVPFFFICSGFFLGKKLGAAREEKEYRKILGSYGKHLLVPYIIWGVWYFFVEIAANKITEGMSIREAFSQRVLGLAVSGPGGGLWYLQVILIIILILMCSGKKLFRTGLWAASIVLCCIPDLYKGGENELLQFIMDAHVFLWDGVFFLTGIVIGENCADRLTKWNSAALFAGGMLVKVIFSFAGIGLFSRVIKMLIAAGIFGMALKSGAWYSKERSLRFRRWSMIIYFTHITVKYGVQMIFKILHRPESTWVFVISAVIVFFYAVCVDKYFRDKKWYKLLYL